MKCAHYPFAAKGVLSLDLILCYLYCWQTGTRSLANLVLVTIWPVGCQQSSLIKMVNIIESVVLLLLQKFYFVPILRCQQNNLLSIHVVTTYIIQKTVRWKEYAALFYLISIRSSRVDPKGW